jgi:hypothetical protein
MQIEFKELGTDPSWTQKKLIIDDEDVDYVGHGELQFSIHYNGKLNHDILLNTQQITELIMHLEEHVLKQI